MPIQKERTQNPLYMLFGVFFTIIALVFTASFIAIPHKAAGTSAPVANNDIIVSPAQGGADMSSITLTEGGNYDIHIGGTVSDADGSADIVKVMVAFYASGDGITPYCVHDSGDVCYKTEVLAVNLNCVNQIDLNTCTYDAVFPLTYHTSSTTFTAAAAAVDSLNTVSNIVYSGGKTVNSLRSIDIPTFLDYGTLNVGQSASAALTVTNMGNVTTDVKVRSEDMICDGSGSIPATLLTFDGVSLSNSDVDVPDYNLVKQIGGVESTRNSQMSITSVPAAQGICAGNLIMTAY